MERYKIRRFDPENDLEGAYRCFVSGFYHITWPIIEHAERRLVDDIIRALVEMAESTYVAEVDGEARGILVGAFPFETGGLRKEAAAAASLLLRVFTGGYRMRPFARAFFRRMIIGYLPFLFRHPLTPSSETLMLASQKEYRGGIGRAMMDEWLAESSRRGVQRSTVGTDTALSWEFYESYGFQRVREFRQSAYHYSLPGDDVTAYIYSIDLDGHARRPAPGAREAAFSVTHPHPGPVPTVR